jgi:Ca2+-binding EF-hand superfamily protein
MRFAASLLAALLLSLTLAAGARAQGASLQDQFSAIDADGDGSLTVAETVAFQRKVFELLDEDGDGAFSRAEFVAILERQAAEAGADAAQADQRRAIWTQRFDGVDYDQDGIVTTAEFDQAHEFRFASKDTDGDGRLSFAEFGAVALPKPGG